MNSYKTLFDLTILTCSHVVLAPIFVILWIFIPTAIWLEDRGPVFYTQNRLGKNGKLFKLYKFRSMIPDAEKETGAVLASDNDLRVTRVGKFIRKRALDELPQVINLWKGDISLVGPRPERPELMHDIVGVLPLYAERLIVKPGLTGIAQVYGRYATNPRHKLMYDRIYIREMNPILDIKLLVYSVLLTLKAKWQHVER
ncbi:MAG: sugar transferase [SAR202 cluster bacterium]|nr:sugar transferase [SAR202 cluster bacterium]